MIEVQALAKRYPGGRGRADVVAVDGASWRADDGRITALLGANGAGKTTTLRLVAGLIAPDAGGVRVDGIDVAAQPAAARARLGLLGDSRGLYPRLSARENIVYFGRLHGLDAAAAGARAQVLARQLGLAALLDRRCEGFSQGERMKTALARALVHDPANVVLDEPTNGLDVVATRALREVLRRLRDETGKCVVISTHVMQEVERLADEVVVMAAGRTVACGSVAALRAQAGVADFEAAFVRLAYAAAMPAAGEGA